VRPPALRQTHYTRLLRLLVFQHELIDRRRRVKNNDVAHVFRMTKEIAFGDEFESNRFNFFAQCAFFNAMEGFSNRYAVAYFCRVIGNKR